MKAISKYKSNISILLGGLLFAGCYPQPSAQTSTFSIAFQEAEIIAASKSCENDQWRFFVDTDAWTGNGFLIIATEDRSERHPLYSFEASEAGDSDKLRAFLSVIPNWQDFTAGSSTGWLCSQENELSIAVAVQHAVSAEVTDCVYWGDDLWGEYSSLDVCSFWE